MRYDANTEPPATIRLLLNAPPTVTLSVFCQTPPLVSRTLFELLPSMPSLSMTLPPSLITMLFDVPELPIAKRELLLQTEPVPVTSTLLLLPPPEPILQVPPSTCPPLQMTKRFPLPSRPTAMPISAPNRFHTEPMSLTTTLLLLLLELNPMKQARLKLLRWSDARHC